MSQSKQAQVVLVPSAHKNSIEKVQALPGWALKSSSALLAYVHHVVNSIHLPASSVDKLLGHHYTVTIDLKFIVLSGGGKRNMYHHLIVETCRSILPSYS